MIFGSVCSGIEAASVAWYPLGWRAAFISEIEAFPRAVLSQHYPGVPLHGDFTTIRPGDYEPIDVLVGGTPCQSFSIAGLRGGMADPRGNLALEYLRLVDRLRPRWIVWENVPGVLSSNGGRDFGTFLCGLVECGYGFAYRVLDAQYFGLAQRRKRVFVVGYSGDWRRAAAVLFEPASLRGHPAPGQKTRSGTAIGTLNGTSPGGGWRFGADEAAAEQLIPQTATALRARNPGSPDSDRTDTLLAFGGNNTAGPIDIATAVNACHTASGRQDFESETFIAHTLRADGFDASEDGTGRGTPLIAFDTTQITSPGNYSNPQPGAPCHPLAAGAAVRRLTPRECARLQGFPDDYLDIQFRGKPAADGPKYRALGNSMAVPCMAWIGRRIAAANHCANSREGAQPLPAFALSAAAHPTSVVLSGHQNGETAA